MQLLLHVQETEADFYWEEQDLARWREEEGMDQLKCLREELATLEAGTLMRSNLREDVCASSPTGEAHTPKILQQGSHETRQKVLETGKTSGQGQPDDAAVGMPAGAGAKVQAHPAGVLGYAA